MQAITQGMIAGLVATGGSPRVDVDIAPKFSTGERVTAREINPSSHTRTPRYCRGKPAVIITDHGVFGFPDVNAHGFPVKPQHLYTVCFSATDLWGQQANPNDKVYLDLWEDYLE
ncbi:SH3-like domain-containing protein [Pseudomonas syringae]|uniref:SH3-like domain-containing protein n=1 Tax=Pseudomonas syringae TaxID=317 RepID=UPI00190F6D80|nr:SH3-like domain-containing protein [Pseudomonas syringae]